MAVGRSNAPTAPTDDSIQLPALGGDITTFVPVLLLYRVPAIRKERVRRARLVSTPETARRVEQELSHSSFISFLDGISETPTTPNLISGFYLFHG